MIPEVCASGGCLLYSHASQQTCGYRCGLWTDDEKLEHTHTPGCEHNTVSLYCDHCGELTHYPDPCPLYP